MEVEAATNEATREPDGIFVAGLEIPRHVAAAVSVAMLEIIPVWLLVRSVQVHAAPAVAASLGLMLALLLPPAGLLARWRWALGAIKTLLLVAGILLAF